MPQRKMLLLRQMLMLLRLTMLPKLKPHQQMTMWRKLQMKNAKPLKLNQDVLKDIDAWWWRPILKRLLMINSKTKTSSWSKSGKPKRNGLANQKVFVIRNAPKMMDVKSPNSWKKETRSQMSVVPLLWLPLLLQFFQLLQPCETIRWFHSNFCH